MGYSKEREDKRAAVRNREFRSQIGIGYSNARKRLIRSILFDMIVEAGDDTCVICNRKIRTVDKLTKQHILPWRKTKDFEGSKERYWDLNNCLWAHSLCNLGQPKCGKGQSGIRGVSKGRHSWEVKICYLGKVRCLGSFKDISDAGTAYDLGVIIFHEGDGLLNFEEKRLTYDEVCKNINREELIENGKISKFFIELVQYIKMKEKNV